MYLKKEHPPNDECSKLYTISNQGKPLWKQGKTIITIIPPAESLKYFHNGDTQMKYSAP